MLKTFVSSSQFFQTAFVITSNIIETWNTSEQVLQENTRGITPLDGYIAGRHKRIKGNVWLDLLQKEFGKQFGFIEE